MSLPTKIIGVMGSGSVGHAEFAEPLGVYLAEAGYHLITGGGGGVMAAVSQAFVSVADRAGRCVGVLPCADGDAPGLGAPAGYPNSFVEIPIRTHLHLSGPRGEDVRSRNHINVLSADAIVALPGSHGTASEVRLARRYGRPVIVFGPDRGCIPDLPEDVPQCDSLDVVKDFLSRQLP